MKKYLLIFIFLAYFLKGDIKIKISIPKNTFQVEEEVILKVEFINSGDKTEFLNFQYLQPGEKNYLFIGDDFKLEVKANGKVIENFTNYIPPEPKPGNLKLNLKQGEKFVSFCPFTFYYYPVVLPAEFTVRLKYKNNFSNPVFFKIYPTKGKVDGKNIIINGDFKDGENFPYGWKNTFKEVKWDKKEGIISFELNKQQASGEGMWVYSIFREIEAPSKYILKLKVKSENPEVIIFIEGWGIVKGRKRRIERNECFVHPDNNWNDYTFNIIFTKSEVKWFRIKIYSYLKQGKVYFDKIEMVEKSQ